MMSTLTVRAGPAGAAFKAPTKRQQPLARRTCVIVQAKDNPYHDRNSTQAKNP
jgi:hypothetical protein